MEKGAKDAIIIQGASGGTNPRSVPARAAQMQTAAISVAARKTGTNATSQTTPTPATSTRCAGWTRTAEKGAEGAIIIQGVSGGNRRAIISVVALCQ